ncbi:MAG: multicopper oxidase family protein [Rhodocyclaceae bacterium]|nr:multicopper oxidase family protein [Rhodocyclaceae bacterium]
MFSRREFLKSAGALATGATLPAWAAAASRSTATKSYALRPAEVELALAGVAGKTNFWAFNGTVPGQTMRIRRGERVQIQVDNGLGVDTTIHWHGVRVPNAMDGVPQVTQAPIKPNIHFDYEWVARDSGTFWYHPHQSSFEQVPRGLYGALIVEEDKPITVDRDEVWMLADIKLDEEGRQVEDFGRILDFGNEGRLGNHVLVNGQPGGRLTVRSGERIRLRLINAASARVFKPAIAGHSMTVIAYDGQAVEPHAVEVLDLGPGMRADIVIDCMHAAGTTFAIVDRHRRSLGEIGRIVYQDGKAVRNKPLKSSLLLPGNRLPEPNIDMATDHYIVFQGGMRGAPIIGTIDGKPGKIQELMEKHGLTWTMNFSAQHEHALMHEPLLHFRKGEHVRLHMINETEYTHPMHLHGHFFRVLAVDGKATRFREWRDTVLMPPRSSVEVAFVADNPGEWMYHCHILDHAAGGMMGTFLVE